jgi:hypothetical protein
MIFPLRLSVQRPLSKTALQVVFELWMYGRLLGTYPLLNRIETPGPFLPGGGLSVCPTPFNSFIEKRLDARNPDHEPRTTYQCSSHNCGCHSERTGPQTFFSLGVVSEESAFAFS